MHRLTAKPVYHCRECGSVSYHPVIDRMPNGSLRPTGQCRCSGCRNIFASVQEWWAPSRLGAEPHATGTGQLGYSHALAPAR